MLINRRELLLLALLTLIAAALRFYNLSAPEVELDEQTAILMRESSLIDIWFQAADYDSHPPLYYFFVRVFLENIPDRIIAIRLFSVIVGSFTVPAIWFMARRPYNAGTAWMAACLLAFNPAHIGLSQLGRMYALLAFLAVYCAVMLEEVLARKNARFAYYSLILALLTGLYSQYVFWTVPVALFVRLLVFRYNSGKTDNVKKAAGAIIISSALFFIWPTYLTFFRTSLSLADRVGIYYALDYDTISQNTARFFLGEAQDVLVLGVSLGEFMFAGSRMLEGITVIAVVLTLMLYLFVAPEKSNKYSLIYVLVPLALHLAVSVAFKLLFDSTVYYTRYMAVIIPGLCVLLAATTVYGWRASKYRILLIFPAILFLAQLRGVSLLLARPEKASIYQVTEFVDTVAQPDDLLLLSPVLKPQFWLSLSNREDVRVLWFEYWNPWHNRVSPAEFQVMMKEDAELIGSVEKLKMELQQFFHIRGLFAPERRVWFVEEYDFDPYSSPKDRVIRSILEERKQELLLESIFENAGFVVTLWR